MGSASRGLSSLPLIMGSNQAFGGVSSATVSLLPTPLNDHDLYHQLPFTPSKGSPTWVLMAVITGHRLPKQAYWPPPRPLLGPGLTPRTVSLHLGKPIKLLLCFALQPGQPTGLSLYLASPLDRLSEHIFLSLWSPLPLDSFPAFGLYVCFSKTLVCV